MVPSPSSQQQLHHHLLHYNNRTPVFTRTKLLGVLSTATTPSPHPSSSSSGYMTSSGGHSGGLTPRSIPVEIMSVFHSSSAAGGGGSDHDYGCVGSSSSGLTPITPSPSVGRQGAQRPLFVTPGSEGSYNRARVVHNSGGSKSVQPVKVRIKGLRAAFSNLEIYINAVQA